MIYCTLELYTITNEIKFKSVGFLATFFQKILKYFFLHFYFKHK